MGGTDSVHVSKQCGADGGRIIVLNEGMDFWASKIKVGSSWAGCVLA